MIYFEGRGGRSAGAPPARTRSNQPTSPPSTTIPLTTSTTSNHHRITARLRPHTTQVIDVAGYFLDLVVQQYDVIQHLDGQPLQAMVKDKASGQYLFNLLYWSKRQQEETARLRAEGQL